MGLSASAVGSFLLLFVGLMLAVVEIGNRSREMKDENQVETPLIGLSQRQGPWPKCLGMESENCVRYIEALAEDVRGHIEIIDIDRIVKFDFNPHRVRILVNETNFVIDTPRRG